MILEKNYYTLENVSPLLNGKPLKNSQIQNGVKDRKHMKSGSNKLQIEC